GNYVEWGTHHGSGRTFFLKRAARSSWSGHWQRRRLFRPSRPVGSTLRHRRQPPLSRGDSRTSTSRSISVSVRQAGSSMSACVTGGVRVRAEDLRLLGLVSLNSVQPDEEGWVSLDAVPGIAYRYDAPTQRLILNVAPSLWELQ